MKKALKILIVSFICVACVVCACACNKYEDDVYVSAEDSFRNNFRLACDNRICLKKDDKWGYLDKDGNVALAFVYSDAEAFIDGKAIVAKDGAYGVIDTDGKEVIACKYSDLVYSQNVNMYIATQDGKSFLLNEKGKVKGESFASISKFSGGVALAENEDGKFFIINTKGKVVWEIYDTAKYAKLYTGGYVSLMNSNGFYGLYTSEGECVIKPQLGFSSITVKGGAAVVMISVKTSDGDDPDDTSDDEVTSYFGLYGLDGKKLTEVNYDSIDYSDIGTFVVMRNNKVGVLNTQGAVVLTEKYYGIKPISDSGFYFAGNIIEGADTETEDDDVIETFVLDSSENLIKNIGVNVEITTDWMVNGYMVFVFEENGSEVYKQYDGSFNVTMQSDKYLWYSNEDLVCVYDGEKYGAWAQGGGEVIPIESECELIFVDGISMIAKDKKFGIINTSGNYIAACEYTRIKTAGDEFALQ